MPSRVTKLLSYKGMELKTEQSQPGITALRVRRFGWSLKARPGKCRDRRAGSSSLGSPPQRGGHTASGEDGVTRRNDLQGVAGMQFETRWPGKAVGGTKGSSSQRSVWRVGHL